MMDGAGDKDLLPIPVLLVDGHDMREDGSGESANALAERLDELSTDEFMMVADNSPNSDHFEKIIGAIEEIVVAEEFQALQNYFLSTYWTKFSEHHRNDEKRSNSTGGKREDEEQHEHFTIFQTYSQDMAHLLETQLKKAFRDEHFEFNSFVEEFSKRAEKGDERDASMFESEIFEMLFTLVDFVKFKELFMDYKEMMEGKTPNLSTGITLKPLPASSPRH